MPIIIDNFFVNTALPIDNRFVVGPGQFYPTRNAITDYKYVGLRVWDSNDNIPYYWDGTQWLSENSVGVLADTSNEVGALSDYIAKFTSGPTTLGRSIIYENPGTNQIGIGLIGNTIDANIPFSTISEPSSLHVLGNIKTNNHFIGKGKYVTDINASYINDGLLRIQHISSVQVSGYPSVATGNFYVLGNNVNGLNPVFWTNVNTLTVLNSTNTTNIETIEDPTSAISYVTFVNASGTNTQRLKINSSKMQFNPTNGQLLLSDGSESNPVYSFLNSNGGINTGMYYNGDISFAFPSGRCFSIRPGTITIYDINYTQIDFYKSTTDVQKLFVGQGSILKYRTNAWSDQATQIASDNIVWHSGNLYTLRNSGNLNIETDRNTNSQSFDANNNPIQGVYTYNYYGAQPLTTIPTPISNVFTNTGNIGTSQHVYFSVLSFGKGTEGSVQLASNWVGNNSNSNGGGNVVADREILIRSLRDTPNSVWSPWVKIWNSGNSGYVPFGAIMMWSGTIAQIPTGWRLCDGNNGVTIPILPGSVPGQPLMQSIIVPDLRNRFIIGATSGTTTNITGISTQTGGTKDAVVVSHSHTLNAYTMYSTIPPSGGQSNNGTNLSTANSGFYFHAGFGTPPDTNSQGVSGTNQNLPPYYALAFIIYTGI